MIEKLLEEHKRVLIAVLSGLILLGSGISLGVGFIETAEDPSPMQFSGLEEVAPEEISAPQVQSATFPININTASSSELELLSGIGPSKANSIIEYREGHGRFKATSEIMNVSGIGPKTYEKIKGQITVGSQ